MIIARRVLYIVEQTQRIPVPVSIEAPVQDQTDDCWSCGLSVHWPDRTYEMRMVGVDAFMALDLAMKAIGSYLYVSGYHDEGVLEWLKPGTGYGFPIATNLRDLLIGQDAKDQ